MEQETITDFFIGGGPMAKQGSVQIQEMALNKIKLAKNSRLTITDEEIAGLMQSIKEVGLLQPIGVVQNANGYEICYGNRRFLAVSKLGFSKIPVIVHKSKTEVENDLKNLTENLQRRNITLTEAGRYMSILKESKLSIAEIAVRLGVTKSYVQSCLNAYHEVPKEYRDDLEVRSVNDRKREPGKISIATANAIINAEKSFGLSNKQTSFLFEAAKTDDRFNKESIRQYVAAIKKGSKDPIGTVPKIQNIKINFYISEKEKAALEEKYVNDGPFKSFAGLCKAILRGEKSVKINIVN